MPRTTIPALQTYLESLLPLIAASDKAAFVKLFIPLDCGPEDHDGFLADLSDPGEGVTQWLNLTAEIKHIAAGEAHTVDEDDKERVTFLFEHPLLERCDREVVFVLASNIWRAEG